MNVTFNQTTNHTHEIYINGFKAGLITLLSGDPRQKVSSTDKMDWRVFFWGRYQNFQISYKELGLWVEKHGVNISLVDMQAKVTDLLQTQTHKILPTHYFIPKGYVFAHSDNGKIYTINKEYQDSWCEYFHLGGVDYLFDSLEVLKERVVKLQESVKRSEEEFAKRDPGFKWAHGKMIHVDYRMVSALFDTDYYDIAVK